MQSLIEVLIVLCITSTVFLGNNALLYHAMVYMARIESSIVLCT